MHIAVLSFVALHQALGQPLGIEGGWPRTRPVLAWLLDTIVLDIALLHLPGCTQVFLEFQGRILDRHVADVTWHASLGRRPPALDALAQASRSESRAHRVIPRRIPIRQSGRLVPLGRPQATGPLQHMLFHVLSPFRFIDSFKYRRPNEMEQEGVHAGDREMDGGNNELLLRTCMASDSCQLVTEASTEQNSREDGSMGTSSRCCVIPVDLCGDPKSGMRTGVHTGYTMWQGS